MKKVLIILVTILSFTGISSKIQAENNSYFVGKWELTISDAPSDNSTMVVNFEYKNGKLTGTMTVGKEVVKIERIVEQEKSLSFYFVSPSSGYDVNVVMNRKDDNSVTGSVMDMFSLSGKRLIEKNKAK